MHSLIDVLLVAIVLSDLLLLSSSRLATCINVGALQGLVLAILTAAARGEGPLVHLIILMLGTIGLKGIIFPRLLRRAIRGAEVRREVEPFVSYTFSIVVGTVALGVALWLGSRLPLPSPAVSPLVIPVALFTILVGLFLIISRRKAVTQALGYLVLENGIYVFGVALVQESSLLIELGVLLDVFAAVFIMGIMIFHINREFDHLDVDRLAALKE